jgi:hypothetical protein
MALKATPPAFGSQSGQRRMTSSSWAGSATSAYRWPCRSPGEASKSAPWTSTRGSRKRSFAGRVPFKEAGCESVLREALEAGTFHTSLDREIVSRGDVVIVVIGTPVDRHLNPEFEQVWGLLRDLAPFLVDGQLLVLRSTVYPGTTTRAKRAGKAR